MEVEGRTCKQYFVFGVFDVIDFRDVEVPKAERGNCLFSIFLIELLKQLVDGDYHLSVKMSNVINPRVEDFLIRIGFRAIAQKDYMVLWADLPDTMEQLRRAVIKKLSS